MYYSAETTESDIARQLGISISKVKCLLQTARRQWLVRILLYTPLQYLFDLDEQLKETFHIPDVAAFSRNTGDTWTLLSLFGGTEARCPLGHLQDGDVVATCERITLHAVVKTVQSQCVFRMDVISVLRGVQGCGTANVHFIATRLGGRAFHLHSRALTELPQQHQALLVMGPINDIFNITRQANTALLGVGTVNQKSSCFVQFTALSAEDLKQNALLYYGISKLLANVCDLVGKPCAELQADRAIGLTLEGLLAVPLRIGAAGLLNTATAISRALRGGFLNTQITNETAGKKSRKLSYVFTT